MIAPQRSTGSAGFALVPALFLLVVLGALALVAIRVGTGEQQSVTLALVQAQALAAANSGIEWGGYQALNGNCSSSTTLTLTEAALSGFTVIVGCSATAFANGVGTNTAYLITATATAGIYGQPSFVQRVMSATFTDATS